jgi:hypothetical protein
MLEVANATNLDDLPRREVIKLPETADNIFWPRDITVSSSDSSGSPSETPGGSNRSCR